MRVKEYLTLDVGCEKYQYIDAQIKIKGGFLEFL
jgi:hypothetical protein